MKLFNETYYHGSGNKFDKFDFNFMGKGQGCQSHGWGIYLAKDKNIGKSYRDFLSDDNKLYILSIDGNIIQPTDNEYLNRYDDDVMNYIKDNYDDIPSMSYGDLQVMYEPNSKSTTKVSNIEEYISNYLDMYITYYTKNYNKSHDSDYLEWIKEKEGWKDFIIKHDIKMILHKDFSGMLCTVHVDDDCLFAREDETIDNQDERVKNICIEYMKKNGITENELITDWSGFPVDDEEFLKYFKDNYKTDSLYTIVENFYCNTSDSNIEELYKKIYDWFYHNPQLLNYDSSKGVPKTDLTFRQMYMFNNYPDEQVSMELLDLGLDGISYYGYTDGECVVLFNLDKCEIIQKE